MQKITIEQKTSIVTAVRNRTDRLRISLENWLQFQVAEIVIVDWRDDGCESAWDAIQGLNDKRLKFIETKYEYRWDLCRAFNLAISQVSYPYVCKLDADYILQDNFFDINNGLNESNFICGIKMNYLNGFMYCSKTMFDETGGYNENLFGYGHDDGDLINRLIDSGRSLVKVGMDTISHLEHPMEWRINGITTVNRAIDEQTSLKIKKVYHSANKRISEIVPWGNEMPQTLWLLEKLPTDGHQVERYLAIRKFSDLPYS